MIEVFLVILLASKNSIRARVRGKSGGAAVAYTIVLWLGMEGAAFALLSTLDDVSAIGAYALALLGAGLGALISYIISAAGSEKYTRDDARMYLKKEQLAHLDLREPLETPCKVVAINDAGAVRVEFPLLLNARMVGTMKVAPVTFETSVVQNIISFADAQGIATANPLLFDAPAGGLVEIHYSGNRFVADKLKVYSDQNDPAALLLVAPVAPVAETPAAPVAPVAESIPDVPAAPIAEKPAAPATCPKCGAVLREGAVFCAACGSAIESAAPVAEKSAAPATCTKCGAVLREGAVFCAACGSAVEPVTPAAPVAAAIPTPAVVQKPVKTDKRSSGFTIVASVIDIMHALVTTALFVGAYIKIDEAFLMFIAIYSLPTLIFASVALAALRKQGGCPKWLGTMVRVMFYIGIFFTVLCVILLSTIV